MTKANVQQIGTVTTGHAAVWSGNQQLSDGGPPSTGSTFPTVAAQTLTGAELVFGQQSSNPVTIKVSDIADLAFIGTALLALPAVTSLDGTETVYVVQGGVDKKATVAQVQSPAIPASTFAGRPANPKLGSIAVITDSTTTTWGDTVAGGSTNKVLAWYNGTVWTVIGN